MNLARLIFVAIILMSHLLAGCSERSPDKFRLGTNVWPGYEPLYLARDLKYWDNQSIRLIEYPSASEVLRAFRNGALEAASLTLDEVLQLRKIGIPIAIVLIHDISNGADAIIAHSDILRVSGLRGKQVGVESSALGAFMISRALELSDMSVTDINIKHIGVDLHEKYFTNEEVDAVVTFDPVRTRLLKQGANQLFDSTMIPGEIVDVLAVRLEYLEKHPDIIKQLVDGWFKSLDYITKNSDDAYLRISNRLKIDVNEVKASYEQLVLPDKEMNRRLLTGEQAGLLKTVGRLNKVLLENGLIDRVITNDQLLDDRFIGN